MKRRWLAAAAAGVAIVALVSVLIVALSTGAASRNVDGCAADQRGGQHCRATAPTTAPPSTTTPTTTSLPSSPRMDDGSLGYQAPRVACTLLDTAEISRVFRAPVQPGVAVYPYCQWLIGQSTWLALQVERGVSFNAATPYVATIESIRGLGQRAIVANDHVLYFTADGTTFGISVQYPLNFEPTYDVPQLTALAHDVLGHRLPAGQVGVRPRAPAGPPIYFAGDSTAAGPEWAFWQYYTDQHPTSPTRTLFEYQVGTGFVRYNFFNWSRHLLAVAAARRPKLVIFMGSANDGQAMIVHGQYAAVGSPAWTAEYKELVGSTLSPLVGEGCKVLWIGEPAMESAWLSASMRDIDGVYAEEAAAHPGVTFMNPGTWLDGPHGTYTGEVKIGGRETGVFLDGIHLNTVGSAYLAAIIDRYVDRILGLKH
ncbi:MAG TPA: hypothetical protein VGP46_09965 [Acidimicrobiales bacterium]|nr:hypothetical protein [Acidimicrobiales bacterium]